MRPGSEIFYLLVLITRLLAGNSHTEKLLREGTLPRAGDESLYLVRGLQYCINAQIKKLASCLKKCKSFVGYRLLLIDNYID